MFCNGCDNLLQAKTITDEQHRRWINTFWGYATIASNLQSSPIVSHGNHKSLSWFVNLFHISTFGDRNISDQWRYSSPGTSIWQQWGLERNCCSGYNCDTYADAAEELAVECEGNVAEVNKYVPETYQRVRAWQPSSATLQNRAITVVEQHRCVGLTRNWQEYWLLLLVTSKVPL